MPTHRGSIRNAVLTAIAAVVACVATAAPVAPAGRSGPNADPAAKLSTAESPALSAVERLALANRLAAWGQRNSDPVALIQAAKIRKGIAGGGEQDAAAVEALLARAEALAPGNPAIRGLVVDARAYRSRDLPLLSAGVATLTKLVRSLSADRADLTFRGETAAVVYVHSTEDVDLDLYVYDEYNNLICSDESTGQEAQCRWRPRWTGSFLVDVRNKHDREVEYVLAANDVRPGTPSP